jgi:hypothetical protein
MVRKLPNKFGILLIPEFGKATVYLKSCKNITPKNPTLK